MAQQGGLGRGLSSLIPRKKQKTDQEVEGQNYYGGSADVAGDAQPAASNDEQARPASQSRNASAEQVPTPSNQSQSGGQKDQEKLSGIALKSIMEIPIDVISPNPHQPRSDFNEASLQELASSIKEHGVLQPLVVSRKDDGSFELIAGERRLQASKLAGLEKVPVIIKKVNEQNKAEISLIENIQRYDLNPIEEARAYKKLQDAFDMTQEEISTRVGKSRSTVSNAMRLLNLPVEMQKAITDGTITEGHARSILSLSNPQKQQALFELILKNNLTVRQAEDKVREATKDVRKPRRKADPQVLDQENQLSQALGTKVRIKKSQTGGQIIIDFYSDEEFNSLLINLSKGQ